MQRKIKHKDKEPEREKNRHKAILYCFLPQHRSSPVSLRFQGISL